MVQFPAANVSNKFYKGNQFSGFCAVTSKKNGRKKEKEDQASYWRLLIPITADSHYFVKDKHVYATTVSEALLKYPPTMKH